MPTKDQIKNEFFISLCKRLHEPLVNDMVVLNLVRSGGRTWLGSAEFTGF